jgi:FAD synthetase
MVTVMASGVFDLLHLGHLHYLQDAKKMGDELVVVVATDETVRKLKHDPITPQEIRREMVASLKPVDRAVVGSPTDSLKIVEDLLPDVIAIGYDQNIGDLPEQLQKRGLQAKIMRCSRYTGNDLNGTRKIIDKIYKTKDFYKGK